MGAMGSDELKEQSKPQISSSWMMSLGSLMNEKQRDLRSQIKILDVGAGTGRYSVPLAEEGYDVTALELVKA